MTKVQKKVLLFMAEHGGEAIIGVGHKTVAYGTMRGRPAIAGNQNLTWGLKCQGFAELIYEGPGYEGRALEGGHVWRLTEKARAAISRMKTPPGRT